MGSYSGTFEHAFDALGRNVGITDPLGNRTTYADDTFWPSNRRVTRLPLP